MIWTGSETRSRRPGRLRRAVAMGLAAALWTAPALADPPSVLEATVEAQSNSLYAFQATIGHEDEGFAHYVNAIEVVDTATGTVLASRPVFAPQKAGTKVFTKSLSNVEIPIGVTDVLVRAVCSKDGTGTRTVTLALPPRK